MKSRSRDDGPRTLTPVSSSLRPNAENRFQPGTDDRKAAVRPGLGEMPRPFRVLNASLYKNTEFVEDYINYYKPGSMEHKQEE